MDDSHVHGGHKATSIAGNGVETPRNESHQGEEEYRSTGGGPGRVVERELRVSPADSAVPLIAPS